MIFYGYDRHDTFESDLDSDHCKTRQSLGIVTVIISPVSVTRLSSHRTSKLTLSKGRTHGICWQTVWGRIHYVYRDGESLRTPTLVFHVILTSLPRDVVITQEARDTIQLSSHMTWRLSYSRLSWWRKQTWKFWQRRCISCKRWYKTGITKILRPRRLQYYKNLTDEFAGQWKATFDVFGRSCRDKIFRDDREDDKINVIPLRHETESEHKARRTCRKSGRQCFSRQLRNNMIEYPFSMQDGVYIF